MQKMNLRVGLRVAYKVLKTLVEASWDTLDEYISFQKSKNIKERPYEKVGGKPG
jgi:hypothetical protein